MPVYIAAAAQLLVYLWAVPVHLAFCVHLGDDSRLGVGFAVFDPGAALRQAWRGTPKRRDGNAPDWRDVLRMMTRLRLSRAMLRGRLGLGDAALTAVACGGLAAAARGLFLRAERSQVDVRPDFSGDSLRLEFRGMLSARAGQIIYALLLAGLDDMKGRVRTWTDIRLKAS